MLCVIPVFSGEVSASYTGVTADKLLAYITELGGVQRHSLLLVTTPPVNHEPLIALAAGAWADVSHIRLTNEVPGWPQGPNTLWLAAAAHLDRKGIPWLHFECDCLPHHPAWLDNLESEYQSCGKPFMGRIHCALDPLGAPMENHRHMNGAGIYPPNVLRHLPSAQWIDTTPLPPSKPNTNAPWDLALRHEMLSQVDGKGGYVTGPDGARVSNAHHTDMIRFAWKSCHYRFEDGEVKFDCNPAPFAVPLDVNGQSFTHGCKDTTLLDLLTNRMRNERKQHAPEVTPVVEPPPEPEVIETETLTIPAIFREDVPTGEARNGNGVNGDHAPTPEPKPKPKPPERLAAALAFRPGIDDRPPHLRGRKPGSKNKQRRNRWRERTFQSLTKGAQ